MAYLLVGRLGVTVSSEREKIMSILKVSMLFLLFSSMISCTSTFYPGSCHDNFKALHQTAIGKSLDDPNNFYTRYKDYYREHQILPSGNIEYVQDGFGTCKEFYEVNLTSRTIVGWRFEGKEQDCEICP